MAITVVGTSQFAGVGNGNSATITFGTPPIQDDLVILVGGHPNGTAAPVTTGYNLITVQGGVNPRFGAWYKFMGGTPDTDVVGNGTGSGSDGNGWACIILRGVDLSTPQDAAATTSSSADPAAITTVTNGAFVVIGTGRNNLATALGTVAGYTNITVGAGVDTNRMNTGIARKEVAIAGVEDPPQWNSGSLGNEFSITMAFRPAGAGVAFQPITSFF